MAWLICGSVPDAGFELYLDTWTLDKTDILSLSCRRLSIQRGTPALVAAALAACSVLRTPGPLVLLCGDIGTGSGSAALYAYLAQMLTAPEAPLLHGLTFHYLFPNIDGHNKVFMALEAYAETHEKPLTVADAGFMYVAKMSGYADGYDLFTPDIGELAFLADEEAPHPFYTRGFLLAEDKDVPMLISRAYEHGNCARNLLVKGAVDCIAANGQVTDSIAEPCIPFMEPIGGTGDMVTGIATALLDAGKSVREACVIAARTCRIVGRIARPTPATQINELIPHIPEALRLAIEEPVSNR